MQLHLISTLLLIVPFMGAHLQDAESAEEPAQVASFLRFATDEVKRELCGEKSFEAILGGLAWLAQGQLPDGAWNAGKDPLLPSTANTALVLLAFLGDGHNTRDGEYGENIASAAKWLSAYAADEDDPRAQGMALTALARLAFDDPDAVDMEVLAKVERSLLGKADGSGLWTAREHPSGLSNGVTMAWCSAGLVQAEKVGLPIADKVRGDLMSWANGLVQESGKVELPTASGSSEHGTAMLLVMRLMLSAPGTNVESLVQQANRLTLPAAQPGWDQEDQEYWLATTTALYLMKNEGAPTFYTSIRSMLLENLLRGGEAAGSWPGLGMVPEAGTVRSTAMAVLSLESPCRLAQAPE